MALIKCPECAQDISDRAKICPKCGLNLKKYQTPYKLIKRARKIVASMLWYGLGSFGVALFFIISFIYVFVEYGEYGGRVDLVLNLLLFLGICFSMIGIPLIVEWLCARNFPKDLEKIINKSGQGK
jgi:hypothetical protein